MSRGPESWVESRKCVAHDHRCTSNRDRARRERNWDPRAFVEPRVVPRAPATARPDSATPGSARHPCRHDAGKPTWPGSRRIDPAATTRNSYCRNRDSARTVVCNMSEKHYECEQCASKAWLNPERKPYRD